MQDTSELRKAGRPIVPQSLFELGSVRNTKSILK